MKLLEFPEQDHEINCLNTVETAFYSEREDLFVALTIDALIELYECYDSSMYRTHVLGSLYELKGLLRDFYDE